MLNLSVLVGQLYEFSDSWVGLKTFVEHAIGFSHDALHVILGVCLQLLLAAGMRIPVSSIRLWTAILALEVVNEWMDLRVEVWPDRGMQWGESAKDLLLTMFLPTVLLVAARYRPQLFAR